MRSFRTEFIPPVSSPSHPHQRLTAFSHSVFSLLLLSLSLPLSFSLSLSLSLFLSMLEGLSHPMTHASRSSALILYSIDTVGTYRDRERGRERERERERESKRDANTTEQSFRLLFPRQGQRQRRCRYIFYYSLSLLFSSSLSLSFQRYESLGRGRKEHLKTEKLCEGFALCPSLLLFSSLPPFSPPLPLSPSLSLRPLLSVSASRILFYHFILREVVYPWGIVTLLPTPPNKQDG